MLEIMSSSTSNCCRTVRKADCQRPTIGSWRAERNKRQRKILNHFVNGYILTPHPPFFIQLIILEQSYQAGVPTKVLYIIQGY